MNILKILILVITTSILSANSANTIYLQKCSGCHGHNGDKTVLGKSKIINQMKADEIEEALYSYAAGTCKVDVQVCEPKNPMIQHGKKSFVQHYTKEQIHALAVYISELK
ncbi:c-type cytochrome [Campylobacterota bacterium]